MPLPKPLPLLFLLLGLTLLSINAVQASSGDRNPTFQHCLKGCQITYCDPSQPPIPAYLRAFGWTCEEDCRYSCGHSFTDHIRRGSRWHQFYGKWPFYRFGPIQEPISVLLSLGNFYINLLGIQEVRRRVRVENRLRGWLVMLGVVQVNTWAWSAVFHSRDTPLTERLDYFSATLTISSSLLYTAARVLLLQTPLSTSRLLLPLLAGIAFLVILHFTYLLSFPVGHFPYGYHTKFNVLLGLAHNTLWVLWSLSYIFKYPTINFAGFNLSFPKAYHPRNPLDKPRHRDALTPLVLVLLTLGAMSFELWDFPPVVRMVDAHAVWHGCTIPLAMGWWRFLCNDAIELEGSLLGAASGSGQAGQGARGEKMPLSGINPSSDVGSGSGSGLGLGGLMGSGETGRKSMSVDKNVNGAEDVNGVSTAGGGAGGPTVPHYVQIASARADEKIMRD